MTTYNAFPYGGLLTTPQTLPSADQGYGGREVAYTATITLASQVAGSVFRLWKARAGLFWLGGTLITDTSLGSTTIEIGNATTANLYRALAAYTTTGNPTGFFDGGAGFLINPPVPLAAAEEVLLTTAAATLPSSGTLLIIGKYMVP